MVCSFLLISYLWLGVWWTWAGGFNIVMCKMVNVVSRSPCILSLFLSRHNSSRTRLDFLCFIIWPLLVLRSAVFHPSKLLSSCGFLCLQCSPGFDKLPSPPPIPPATSLCTHQHHFLSGHAVLDFSGQASSALGFTTPPPRTFLTLTATVTSV